MMFSLGCLRYVHGCLLLDDSDAIDLIYSVRFACLISGKDSFWVFFFLKRILDTIVSRKADLLKTW